MKITNERAVAVLRELRGLAQTVCFDGTHITCADELPALDAAIAALSAPQPLAEAQAQGGGEVTLPCDVRLPPATTITAGCKLSTLLSAMELRRKNGVVNFPASAPPSAPVGFSVYAALRSIRYNAENGSQDRPLHVRLQLIAEDARRAIAACEAAPPSAPVGVEDKARAMFEAQADKLAVSWDQQWEPTKDFWRKRAAEALAQQPAADDRICSVCDGGPGNDGPCLCGERRWEQPAPSAPVGEARQAKEWLLELMGDHDFCMPSEAFDELVEALAAQPPAEAQRCTCPHQDAREPDHDVACPARLAQQPAAGFTTPDCPRCGCVDDGMCLCQPAAVDGALEGAVLEVAESINRFRDEGTRPHGGTLTYWEATLRRALAAQPGGSDNDR